jgi:transcription initiation factor TFIIB
MDKPKEDPSKGGRECPVCGSPEYVYDPVTSEEVCYRCGFVLWEKRLDRRPEWRAFTSEEKAEKMRASGQFSFTYYDKGLRTSFRTDWDSQGRQLRQDTRDKMRRLKRWDIRSKLAGSDARNLSKAMNELIRLADILHLPDVVRERAAILYRKALEKDLIMGRTIAGFVAASLYAACRQLKTPRSLKEVSEASTRDVGEVSMIYRLLLRELDIKMPVDHPMKFIPRIASVVGVSRRTDQVAVEILREAQRQKALAGKDPRGIAAAALYLACKIKDERCTQKEIAEAAGTSEVTIRNRLKDLKRVIDENNIDRHQAAIENKTAIKNGETLRF